MELRKQHIEKFKKLSPEERLQWALQTGWEIHKSLSEKAKRIEDYCRNGGKQQFSGKLE